ncbi:MAG TPA: hypothetical protein VMM84_12995 [Pyrinomonadaceae bacterium]|nr:hypothetical protein [Pyrinomonadaceae bacterium]
MMHGNQLLLQWIRATFVGWILGIPLIIVLALVGEAAGIGGAQVIVGVGMGAGVGLMQGRIMRTMLGKLGPWVWSSVVGLGLPFFMADIAGVVRWDSPYSLYLAVILAGLIVGIFQAFILRSRFHNTGWWVVGSVVGWSMASATIALADTLSRAHSLRGVWGALAYLATVAAGGLVLGIVTGIALVGMLRNRMGHDSVSVLK